jgi:hypothetical protein
MRHPSPGALGPACRLRRRYAHAPAGALLTGLGAGEWSPLRSRPYAAFCLKGKGRCPSQAQEGRASLRCGRTKTLLRLLPPLFATGAGVMAGAMTFEEWKRRMSGETYLGPDGKRYPMDVERTEQGLQLMLGGVRPLVWLAAQPLQPRKRQKPCDIGLFDTESRWQLALFGP